MNFIADSRFIHTVQFLVSSLPLHQIFRSEIIRDFLKKPISKCYKSAFKPRPDVCNFSAHQQRKREHIVALGELNTIHQKILRFITKTFCPNILLFCVRHFVKARPDFCSFSAHQQRQREHIVALGWEN